MHVIILHVITEANQQHSLTVLLDRGWSISQIHRLPAFSNRFSNPFTYMTNSRKICCTKCSDCSSSRGINSQYFFKAGFPKRVIIGTQTSTYTYLSSRWSIILSCWEVVIVLADQERPSLEYCLTLVQPEQPRDNKVMISVHSTGI